MSYDNRPEGTTRLGNWMQTATGRMFWPLDPRAGEVFIEDIAASLSKQCRFAGHCKAFYSVAEHSVLVSRLVPPEAALHGLLHDASEAYVVDVPRPLKPYLSEYKGIEDRVWEAIADRFGLPREMPSEIKLADNAMLIAEAQQNMLAPPADWKVAGEAAPLTIPLWSPREAEVRFLRRFRELTQKGS